MKQFFGPLMVSLDEYKKDEPKQDYGKQTMEDLTEQDIKIIQHKHVGGIILFTRNYKNKKQVTDLIKNIKMIAKEVDKDIFIAVDHEGYKVQRFRNNGFTILKAPQEIGEAYDRNNDEGIKLAREYGKTMASELKEAGVDISLAPVADLDAGNKVISGLKRAFHKDPEKCIIILKACIEGMQEAGMFATLKHFPGHGQDIGDSHKTCPIDTRSKEDIFGNDLKVFKELIKLDYCKAIMPAHIKYTSIDKDNTATMSKIWLKDILRDEIGFNGVVISDCLSMVGAGNLNKNENEVAKKEEKDQKYEKDLLINDLVSRVEGSLAYVDIALLCNQKPEIVLKILTNLNYEYKEESMKRIINWVQGPTITVEKKENFLLLKSAKENILNIKNRSEELEIDPKNEKTKEIKETDRNQIMLKKL